MGPTQEIFTLATLLPDLLERSAERVSSWEVKGSGWRSTKRGTHIVCAIRTYQILVWYRF